MCGRYTVFSEEEITDMKAILSEISSRFSDVPIQTGEIFPTNLAPILSIEENRLAPRPAYWGFPKWDGKGQIINARAETVMDKKMFRSSLLSRRCVIPSSGFYEWSRAEGKVRRDKYLFRTKGDKMLYMAGISNIFKDEGGIPFEAFTILTTAANDSVAPIHDRMPVILMSDEREAWLRDNDFMERVLTRRGPELRAEAQAK